MKKNDSYFRPLVKYINHVTVTCPLSIPSDTITYKQISDIIILVRFYCSD